MRSEKGKPIVRWGRKATGPDRINQDGWVTEDIPVEVEPFSQDKQSIGRSKTMRKVGWIITLICGMVVIGGVFLAWANVCATVGGCRTGSGWDMLKLGTTLAPFGLKDMSCPYVVLVGGALMAIGALSAFIVSLSSKGSRGAIVKLSIFAMLGAVVAIGGCTWYIFSALHVRDVLSTAAGWTTSINYGFYITEAAAIVGLISAIVTVVFSKGRKGHARKAIPSVLEHPIVSTT